MTENAEKPWLWWGGSYANVEYENMYTHGDFATEDEAIAAMLAEIPEKGLFYIVEAQYADKLAGGDHNPDDFQPFGASRHRKLYSKEGNFAVPA